VNEARTRCTGHRLRHLTRRVEQAYGQALAPAGLTIARGSLLAHRVGQLDDSLGAMSEVAAA